MLQPEEVLREVAEWRVNALTLCIPQHAAGGRSWVQVGCYRQRSWRFGCYSGIVADGGPGRRDVERHFSLDVVYLLGPEDRLERGVAEKGGDAGELGCGRGTINQGDALSGGLVLDVLFDETSISAVCRTTEEDLSTVYVCQEELEVCYIDVSYVALLVKKCVDEAERTFDLFIRALLSITSVDVVAPHISFVETTDKVVQSDLAGEHIAVLVNFAQASHVRIHTNKNLQVRSRIWVPVPGIFSHRLHKQAGGLSPAFFALPHQVVEELVSSVSTCWPMRGYQELPAYSRRR